MPRRPRTGTASRRSRQGPGSRAQRRLVFHELEQERHEDAEDAGAYVAVTRARDRLVLVGAPGTRGTNTRWYRTLAAWGYARRPPVDAPSCSTGSYATAGSTRLAPGVSRPSPSGPNARRPRWAPGPPRSRRSPSARSRPSAAERARGEQERRRAEGGRRRTAAPTALARRGEGGGPRAAPRARNVGREGRADSAPERGAPRRRGRARGGRRSDGPARRGAGDPRCLRRLAARDHARRGGDPRPRDPAPAPCRFWPGLARQYRPALPRCRRRSRRRRLQDGSRRPPTPPSPRATARSCRLRRSLQRALGLDARPRRELWLLRSGRRLDLPDEPAADSGADSSPRQLSLW